MLYPLKMAPRFRHGNDTPWGGDALRGFGKPIPDDHTGESLEVSALPGLESTVENGALAGKTLAEAAEAWGSGLTGLSDGGFPLLLKLVDAREMLSLQVHPDDEYAAAHEGGKRGKTEAWVVLGAPHGARLVYGMDCDTAQLQQAIEANRLESVLNWTNVLPGDVLYIPAGMVHALGDGILLYEIQQSSDVTYRFWDWGRVGLDGQPRQLHMDKALDVTRPELRLPKLPGVTAIAAGGSQTCYISDANFELWRLNVAGDMPLPEGRMLLLTPLGQCKLSWPGGELLLGALETALVPAGLGGCAISGHLPVLMSTTPDGQKVRRMMGCRAEAVAGL